MPDQISLLINNVELSRFASYSVDADFYLAADAFQVETAGGISGIKAGQRVQLKLNGVVELDGIIDAPRRTGGKGKISMKLSGRDLAGLLVDTHCDGYGDIKNVTLKALTETLINKVPFIQRNNVFYQIPKDTPSLTWETAYVEPCRSIFDVLSEKAKACGLVFYAMPDGKFYYGKPKSTGEPVFSIVNRKDGKGNNCFYYDYAEDLSKRFSKVSVISNGQGTDAKTTSQLYTAATVTDSSFPFYKPFYAIETTGAMTPQRQAQMIMDMQRRQGFQLTYKVKGHTQNGRNWAINELCSVDDQVNELHGIYFVYGRRFALSKEEGAYTEVRLGLPGLL
ncbi:MAG: hypothetical protein NTX59_08225 [Elusimicrobia bacterium]|nr:hypothetical protein [Elusimicrobiota bacterium]